MRQAEDNRTAELAVESPPPVNFIKTRTGRVRAVCHVCGKTSRPLDPNDDGQPGLWGLIDAGRGWSVAPFPADSRHSDGSTGSTFTCPACNKLGKAGHWLNVRAYLRGLPVVAERGQHRAAWETPR